MSAKGAVSAFAPATCGNVCVGYDILGLCYEGVGDIVTVTKIPTREVIITSIVGAPSLSTDPRKNTAGIVLLELLEQEKCDFGFSITIDKGIALGSGMGGSAASAVAALVAANAFLDPPLAKQKLLEYSLKGEELASGHGHADNTAPCLYGGLVLLANNEVVPIPFPNDIFLLLLHPHLTVHTAQARAVLKKLYTIDQFATQGQNLAGFICACFKNDKDLLQKSFNDILVEPLRAPLTEGFLACKELAKEYNVLGYTLSGSGPSQLALCQSEQVAQQLAGEIGAFYATKQIKVDHYIGPINQRGATLI